MSSPRSDRSLVAALAVVCYTLLPLYAIADTAGQNGRVIGAADFEDTPKLRRPSKSDAASTGTSTTDTVIMEAGGPWVVLGNAQVGHPRMNRYCTAIASADVVNPGQCGDPVPAALLYVFTITLDELNPPGDAGDERTVEFTNVNCPVGNDARLKAVATTNSFVVPPGRHQIYWLGRSQGSSAAAVDDASLSVVCTTRQLADD